MTKKRVLFIGIGFYDYEDAIVKEFKKQNYEVDYFSETPPNTLLYRFYSRLKKQEKIEAIKAKHSSWIVENSNKNYDLIFIIKGECFAKSAIQLLKNLNSNAKFVLYLWDSVRRIKDIEDKLHLFDKVYSFDRLDCTNNDKFTFNPLFFRNEYLNQKDDYVQNNDIYHLGWYHSDRLILIKKIAEYCGKNNLKFQFILFTGYFSYFIQSILGGQLKNNKRFLIFKPISAATNFANILNSKVVLDIAHPFQTGLTMRTIELVGAQRKIITTNQDIKAYDFYNPNNIFIIDRNDPVLEKSFFQSEYIPVPSEIRSSYSIEHWLKRMIE
ncbi:hypothetical protein [Flavobacterium sp. ov086]|uniref:hypothetical protein n=1 Tax=Flavobacterium sp. ov086 TaxID=1761785 RepID=UPI000B6F2223|nr:hypothetical protein [Flavobacterium sp. ov086]SNR49479.1 hypothetical protein SAMN04487979_10865 [Flavobacterium sp. ov086]